MGMGLGGQDSTTNATVGASLAADECSRSVHQLPSVAEH
jgi:hypothetical protein